ncbi:MAG TPA: hypothetical protein VFY14_07245 [Streptomyces sp.]|nr:hypothetical protein [Streptomyces sp.]
MDTTTWTCPKNPFGHDWNGGTTCRSCDATRTASEALASLLAGREGWDETRAAALVDQHRAQVLHEAKDLSEEIARRLFSSTREVAQQRSAGARTVSWELDLLAKGISELADEAADFFQPGHTYKHEAWTFRCDAITTHPDTGERTVLGWFRFRNDSWRPLSCGEAEWAEGVWTDITGTENQR